MDHLAAPRLPLLGYLLDATMHRAGLAPARRERQYANQICGVVQIECRSTFPAPDAVDVDQYTCRCLIDESIRCRIAGSWRTVRRFVG